MTNSVVKVAALAMACVLVLRAPARNLTLVGIVAGVHVLSAAVQLLYVVALDTSYERSFAGIDVSMTALLAGAAVLDGIIAAVLFALYRAAWRARHDLRFLDPIQHRALVAGADVVLAGRDERMSPDDIAANMDRSIARMRARRLWVYRVALTGIQLHPLLTAKPPLSELEPGRRREHLVHHFQRLGRGPQWWQRGLQASIRVLQQLTYAGYYDDERSRTTTGYRPFSQRGVEVPAPSEPDLRVERGGDLDAPRLETDVCIVGSGAAGSILAHELASAGRDVLVVEGGDYVPPSEMTENEVDMIGRLYADGIMQQTQDFRFTVLQGKTVGGSTTVNNAVSFRPPPSVPTAWNDPKLHDAGLDLAELRDSVRAVEALVGVRTQPREHLNLSGVLYERGVAALGLPPGTLETGVVRANIDGCVGCGYCNIGCRFGAKLSMTERVLPLAQAPGERKGSVRVLAETEVERVRWQTGELAARGEPGRADPRRPPDRDHRRDVRHRRRRDRLEPPAAAQRHWAAPRPPAPGRRAPGVQHGGAVDRRVPRHAARRGGVADLPLRPAAASQRLRVRDVVEPPVAQALNMPGWFEDHFENMLRYERLMAVGALVGTAGNARVRQALTGGADISYVPSPADLRTLAKALRLLGEILFRREPRASWRTPTAMTCSPTRRSSPASTRSRWTTAT